jgi:hypothetical protein
VIKPFKINLNEQGMCMKKMKLQRIKKALHVGEYLHSLNMFLSNTTGLQHLTVIG